MKRTFDVYRTVVDDVGKLHMERDLRSWEMSSRDFTTWTKIWKMERRWRGRGKWIIKKICKWRKYYEQFLIQKKFSYFSVSKPLIWKKGFFACLLWEYTIPLPIECVYIYTNKIVNEEGGKYISSRRIWLYPLILAKLILRSGGILFSFFLFLSVTFFVRFDSQAMRTSCAECSVVH